MGALSVIIGAMGAHAVKKIVDEQALQIFETAARYQMYHSFALLVVAFLYKEVKNKSVLWAGRCFLLGILLFSGSLYSLTFLLPEGRKLGMITPIGGLFFIAGWLLLFYASRKINASTPVN